MGWSWFGLLVVIIIGWALYTGQLDFFGALFWGIVLLVGLPLIIFGIILLIIIIAAIIWSIIE